LSGPYVVARLTDNREELAWNEVDLTLDTDLLRVSLNGGGGIAGGDAGDLATGFGAIALYIGAGEVRFKEVSYKDLRSKGFPTEQVYGATPDRMLRLITCGGLYDHVHGRYLDNVLVVALAV